MITMVTPPAQEPISVEEARQHLRVDTHDDDALIAGYIVAAREYAENVLRRALITQTLDLTLDDWPEESVIKMPRPPLQGVTSITYTDDSGDVWTLSKDWYVVDTAGTPGRVAIRDYYTWPVDVDLQESGAIKIRFTAGYGDNAEDVPRLARMAMMLMIGLLYENRGEGPVNLETIDLLLWPVRAF
jgi:uncharacterized phiE125 gp8 family phage protein